MSPPAAREVHPHGAHPCAAGDSRTRQGSACSSEQREQPIGGQGVHVAGACGDGTLKSPGCVMRASGVYLGVCHN